MVDREFTIKLTQDQALVLSDWLDRVIGTAEFDDLVGEDRAVWSPLHLIAGTLETSLVEVFMPDYSGRLDAARERLLHTLGEAGRSVDRS
ncbi:hypothetical protein [Streptosporangium sandarakinum]|uniref:Uncharacterized protein n=1 Tax=Streptosporangium sandarakinum TaxID=1260955 RepID=A0A852UWU6_9ACTN|nr:hypothetical protein [Streptosporangium sandarakinum]NYF39693.1 hypothetical protein [Streptosporangium sandarakinum]